MERLSAQDLSMLWPEELGWSQDIGALIILDGRRLLDADGRFQIEAAREQIQARLQLIPRFRQLLYRPGFGLGWPLWVDAPSIDLIHHVGLFPLPPQPMRGSCWRPVRSYDTGAWTGRSRCGSCGSCPVCRMDGSACL